MPEEWAGPRPATYPGSRGHAPKSRLSLRNTACTVGLSTCYWYQPKTRSKEGQTASEPHTIEDVLSPYPGQTYRPTFTCP